MKQNFYPHVMKYMGSKSAIMEFVIECLNLSKSSQVFSVLDLFSGSASLAGALRGETNVISNDIQEYSKIISSVYCDNFTEDIDEDVVLAELLKTASKYHFEILSVAPTSVSKIDYHKDWELDSFVHLEKTQRDLINSTNFDSFEYHLFTKYYSGTYWSFVQSAWIDSLRYAIDKVNYSKEIRNITLSAIMYSMSYTTQSTGHFAQYRDAKSISSMQNIIIYRKKSFLALFKKKFIELCLYVKNHHNPYSENCYSTSKDFVECLDESPNNIIVYADPPYAFVHYSRFYHVIETMVKYDYPEVNFKGRYRQERHQSPFSRKSEVKAAFESLFQKVYEKESNLVLSYSNTGMVSLEFIIRKAVEVFLDYEMSTKELDVVDNLLADKIEELDFNILLSYNLPSQLSYNILVKFSDHIHSKMGRVGKKGKEVREMIIIIKRLTL